MGVKGEKLIGFDVRKMWFRMEELWDSTRRSTYLLRSDCLAVLSVDSLVWPSVFARHIGGISKEQLVSLGYDGPALREDWIGPNRPLWADLDALKTELTAYRASVRGPVWIIAETVLVTGSDAQLSPFGPYLEDTSPASLSLEWQLIGYDVADAGQISGLSNCGYSPEERETLSQKWSRRLNSHHLFKTLSEAQEFASHCDVRVREHAPFFVFGLYRVEIINYVNVL